MIEIWRDIKDYEGLYQVSNLGKVKNVKRNSILKCGKYKSGYLYLSLCKDGVKKTFYIHRLVAETFIPNPLNLPQVNHKSENKQDNRVENLEWITAIGNSNHGTRNNRISEKNSKPVIQYTKYGEFIREWFSQSEIKKQLGYDQGFISNCCRGKCKSAYGFIWKYKEKEED